jgi:hypothetical protein
VTPGAIIASGYADEGAIVLRAPQGDDNWHASGYICEIAFAMSLVATIVAIAALVAGRGRAARTGGIISGAGMASMFVSSIASIAAGGSVRPGVLLRAADGARRPARRRRHRRASQQ